MTSSAKRAEIDRNYDVFQRRLATYLPDHRGQHALMHGGEIVDFFAKPGDAYRDGMTRFADNIFSIQEVTDEPIDLGFFSYVGN
jgi:hypothetical protein